MVCWTTLRAQPLHISIHSLTRRPVSQFTLLASLKKGNKPDFHNSAPANEAKALYDQFFAKVQSLYTREKVKNGVFQAMMDVSLVNDGPVGVDYRCEDEQVNRPAYDCFPWSLPVRPASSCMLIRLPGHHTDRHCPTAHGQSHQFPGSRGWGHVQGQSSEAVRPTRISARVMS